jgi:hypothetical protein
MEMTNDPSSSITPHLNQPSQHYTYVQYSFRELLKHEKHKEQMDYAETILEEYYGMLYGGIHVTDVRELRIQLCY